jgi:hypothetical protein
VKLPLVIPLAWIALVLLLLAAAWAVAMPRERLVLALLLLGGLLGPPIFYALLIRPTGFGLQGRHVLPALVAIPLLAGETLYRHRDRAQSQQLKLLAGIVTVAVAALQGAAWYVNATHYAAGGSIRAIPGGPLPADRGHGSVPRCLAASASELSPSPVASGRAPAKQSAGGFQKSQLCVQRSTPRAHRRNTLRQSMPSAGWTTRRKLCRGSRCSSELCCCPY